MSTLPDEIRKALEKPDGISEETMSTLAARYDEQVRAVNERLDEAVALLRKNLRSEAIQSANRRPNVMEAAVALDFPERIEWQEILQFLSVPVPQQLDHDKVRQINEAIVETQPIDELLKQHRKLAIAKAPLSWRLKVLRRIAEVDSMNPIWMEDVEDYEAARQKTLGAEVGTALKENNTTQIASLHQELSQTNWVTPPPAELLQSLTAALANNEYNQKVDSMRGIAANMHTAFSEFNEPAARNLWAQWSQACSELNGPVPEDLNDEVAPAQTWLSELDRANATSQQRTQALRDLSLTMNKSRDLSALRRAYASAQRFDEPIPPEIEQRFHSLIQEIELSQKRKTQFKIISVVTAALLIAGLVGFWQYRQMQQNRVTAAASEFEELINANQLSEADNYWTSLETSDPDLTDAPEMRALHSRLREKIASEENRLAQFASYLEAADNEDDSQIDEDALDEAEKLAVSEDEKLQVSQLRDRLEKYQERLADQDTKAASEQHESLQTQLNGVEQQPASAIDLSTLDAIITKLEGLPQQYPRLDTRVNAQIKDTTKRAEALRETVDNHLAMERKRSLAFRPMLAARDLATYRTALSGYAQAIDSPELKTALNKSAGESKFWSLGLESNELPQALKAAITNGLESQEVEMIQATQSRLTAQSVQNPLLSQFKEVTDGILNDSSDPQAAMASLKEQLSRLPYSDLVSVEVTKRDSGKDEPTRYFVYEDDYRIAEDRLETAATQPLQHVADADGGITSSIIKGPVTRAHGEPQQSVAWLSQQLSSRSSEFDQAWGATFLSLAAAVRQRPELDQLIKEELIFQLLTACAKGSGSMRKELVTPLRLLASREVTRRSWYKPGRPSDRLAAVVENDVIPSLAEAYQAIPRQALALEPATRLNYQWIGFLARTSAGGIDATLHISPKQAGRVYVMCASTADSDKVDILPVGNWNGTDIELWRTSDYLTAGRPLFILRTGG